MYWTEIHNLKTKTWWCKSVRADIFSRPSLPYLLLSFVSLSSPSTDYIYNKQWLCVFFYPQAFVIIYLNAWCLLVCFGIPPPLLHSLTYDRHENYSVTLAWQLTLVIYTQLWGWGWSKNASVTLTWTTHLTLALECLRGYNENASVLLTCTSHITLTRDCFWW